MANTIKEDKIAPIIIDFSQKDMIDESWLRMFGENIKGILKAMFGNVSIPLEIKGSLPLEVYSGILPLEEYSGNPPLETQRGFSPFRGILRDTPF